MVTPIIAQGLAKSSGLFGKFFSFFLKHRLASIFVFYVLIRIIAGGLQSGDWVSAFLDMGKAMINPFQDAVVQIAELNSGVTGLFNSLWEYLKIYFALYMLYLWFMVIMLPVNFLLKDSNPPAIRITLGIFIFYVINVLYAVLGLGESMLYPFTLTKEILDGLIQMIVSPQFSTSFDIFGEAVNNCAESTCVA